MKKVTVHIEDCPINSFKLIGEHNISQHYEEALEKARELYLDLHDEAYRKLMFKDFNALWTPDRQATNDIDPKDGFWAMYVFFFNTCLVKILSERYDIEIVDQTSSEFRNQKHFFEFLSEEGIKYTINEKKRNNKSFKHSLKVFVKKSITNTNETISNTILFFKKEFIEYSHPPENLLEKESGQKTIYLAIPPVSNENLKFYLGWRYSNIFEELKKFKNRGFRILLVAVKDYEKSNSFGFSLLNAIRLVTKKERLKLFAVSVIYKIRVLVYIWSEVLRSSAPLRKFFLKNIPIDFYFALKENRAFDNLFKTYGPGLWIMKGPMVYKGISIRNYNAWKNGVRSLTVSGRVMTSTRLTNSFLKSHINGRFPNVLPHSILVTDSISYETIRNQSEKIDIYSTKMIERIEKDGRINHQTFSITLILQKRNEMESMVDTVLTAIQNFDDVILNIKPHPDFPIPHRLKKKYSKEPKVNVLSFDTPLSEAIKISDLCISCYSSAAFEFVNNSRPIIWLNNVTLNSLLFKDVHEKVGSVADNVEELEQLIRKMKDDSDFYQKLKRKHNNEFQEFANELNGRMDATLNTVIEKELEKV